MLENLKEEKTGFITYDSMINRIMDYLVINKIINKNQTSTIWKTLKWICEENLQKLLNDEVENIEEECNKIVELLQSKSELGNIISDIAKIIKNAGITYSEDFDKICLIVDRDRESFLSKPDNNQYDYVLRKCKENNFGFYITNPCFEFWLLMHFDEIHHINKTSLLENTKVLSKKRFAEVELKRVFPKYK